MIGENLYGFINTVSPYAPILITVASAFDIFFLTGVLLSGMAMMGTVAVLHATGVISFEILIVTALTGTVIGNCANYTVGRVFGNTTFVQKNLQSKHVQKARDQLSSRGLLLFIVVCRFITFTRPIYALLLGSMQIPFKDFFIREVPVALVWVTFWLYVILQGEALYFRLIN